MKVSREMQQRIQIISRQVKTMELEPIYFMYFTTHALPIYNDWLHDRNLSDDLMNID